MILKQMGTAEVVCAGPGAACSACDLFCWSPILLVARWLCVLLCLGIFVSQSLHHHLVVRMRRSRGSSLGPAQTVLDEGGLWVLGGRTQPWDLDPCTDLIPSQRLALNQVLLPLFMVKPGHCHHCQPHGGDGAVLTWQLVWSWQWQMWGLCT